MSRGSPECCDFLDMGIVSKNLNLKPGGWIKMVGYIPPYVKKFSVNLGKDKNDIALHFNPRFDEKHIVYNYYSKCSWIKEHWDTHFPFVPDSTIEIFITFQKDHFDLRMANGYKSTYPNHLKIDKIGFFSTTGDIKLKTVTIQMSP